MIFIRALRFKMSETEVFKVWKFEKSLSKLSHFSYLLETPKTIKDLRRALSFLLDRKPAYAIYEAAIQIEDESGDLWTIQRKMNDVLYLRNGKSLGSDTNALALLMAILEIDSHDPNSSEASGNSWFGDFEIRTDLEDEICAEIYGGGDSSTSTINVIVANYKNKMMDQLHTLNEQFTPEKWRLFRGQTNKVEKLHFAYRELMRQKRLIVSNEKSFDTFDYKMMEQLTHEVSLLEEIDHLAAPLLDPSAHGKLQEEKLQRSIEDLKVGLAPYGLLAIPGDGENLPWKKIIVVLTKFTILQKVVSSYFDAKKKVEEGLGESLKNYCATVERVLSSDLEITAELESCLNTLNIYFSEANSSRKGTIQNLVSRFISPSGDKPFVKEVRKNNLENSKLAIDYALGRLGELHTNVREIVKTQDDRVQSVNKDYDQLVTSLATARENWQRLAEQYNFPETFGLNQLLQFITRLAYLTELRKQQKSLKKDLEERAFKISRLEQLILEWRKVTKSQKTRGLDSADMIITESHAITQYKAKKQRQLQKLKETSAYVSTISTVLVDLDYRINQTRESWAKIFRACGIETADINDPRWETIFNLAKQYETWQSIGTESEKPRIGTQIFESKNPQRVLNVFSWNEKSTEDMYRLEFMKCIENHKSQDCNLLLISDKDLAVSLKSMGLSFAKPHANPPPQRLSPTLQVTSGKEKTDEILKMFYPGKGQGKSHSRNQ